MTGISRRLLMRGGAAAGLLAMAGSAGSAAAAPSGTLRLALPDLPEVPGIGEGRGLAAVVLGPGAVWETLTEIAPSGELVPDLAVAWAAEQGGRVWRLTLRPDARFHDGAPVTAEIVAAGLLARRLPLLPWLEHAEATLDGVRLVFSRPCPDLPFQLADPALAVMSPTGEGSGPFRIERYGGGQAVLARDPGHWRRGGVARLRLEAMPDPAERLAALRSGAVDAAPVTAGQLDRIGRGLRLVRSRGHQHIVLEAAPPLARALALGIDREGLVAGALGGQGRPGADMPFPGDELPPHDPFRARAALARAGLAGARIGMSVAPDVPPAVADRLRAELGELGLDAIPATDTDADLRVGRASGRLTEDWALARQDVAPARIVIPAFADFLLAHSSRLMPPPRIGTAWDLDDGRIAQRWQVG